MGLSQASKPPMELSTLENWLREAAFKIRGPIDAPKFKDYTLPLIFLSWTYLAKQSNPAVESTKW